MVAQNAVNYNQTGMMRMMGIRSQNNSMVTSTMDAHFIEQMIPHHEDAILAQDQAKRQEVKTLAQDIIDSQSKEIDQMKSWYKDWYGRNLPTGSK